MKINELIRDKELLEYMIDKRDRKGRDVAISSLVAVLLFLVVFSIFAIGAEMTISGTSTDTKLVHLTVIALGCEVIVSSNETSKVYAIGGFQTNNTISLPIDSNVTITATLGAGRYIASWYSAGGALAGGGSGNILWFVLTSDGEVAVAAVLNQSSVNR